MTRYVCTYGKCKFSTIIRKEIRLHLRQVHGIKGKGRDLNKRDPLSMRYKAEADG